MGRETPPIDDRNYESLVGELLRRIAVYSPEWTDFNESDPGLTLVELFAFLTETLLRQVDERQRRRRRRRRVALLVVGTAGLGLALWTWDRTAQRSRPKPSRSASVPENEGDENEPKRANRSPCGAPTLDLGADG